VKGRIDELTAAVRDELPETETGKRAAAAGVLVVGAALTVGALVVGLLPATQVAVATTPTMASPSPSVTEEIPASDWTPPPQEYVFACDPIGVVLDPDMGGDVLAPDVQAAVSAVGAAAGRELFFVGTGSTEAVPPQTITVALVPTAADFGPGHADALAVGGYTATGGVIRSGHVEIAADTLPPSGDVAGGARVVLAHELAHALGVGHSSDPDDVMFPTLDRTRSLVFGEGDLRALGQVGDCS
jgi:hypothetical protein